MLELPEFKLHCKGLYTLDLGGYEGPGYLNVSQAHRLIHQMAYVLGYSLADATALARTGTDYDG